MREKVAAALAKVRPALQADGGDVRLVNVDAKEGVVTVQLTGACSGCPLAAMTLRDGIERMLKEQVPQVKQVVTA